MGPQEICKVCSWFDGAAYVNSDMAADHTQTGENAAIMNKAMG
jgi:hypothetical protein